MKTQKNDFDEDSDKKENSETSFNVYFKNNPIYFPDISISDFSLDVNNFDLNLQNLNESKSKLTNISDQDLIHSIIISQHTKPEFLNINISLDVYY